MNYIKLFKEVNLDDVALVGGKTASIGQMIAELSSYDIRVPDGFAVTAQGYFHHLETNRLAEKIKKELSLLKTPDDLEELRRVGAAIRELIYQAPLPADLAQEITDAYHQFEKHYGKDFPVAVRSSATAEDLPHASFAGQQETYLGIQGVSALLDACKKCMASLFTDRAIVYRREQGFDHMKVGLSVAVQKLVDARDAGVMFTLDTESGYKDAIIIEGSYGFGESIVKGIVIPDAYTVHKPTLEQGFHAIIGKSLGAKGTKIVFASGQMKTVDVSAQERTAFCLPDEDILELARAGVVIENHYSKMCGAWTPMDIEWAKDAQDDKLYILQARPETVHALETHAVYERYKINQSSPKLLLTGTSIGQKIATGKVRIARSIDELSAFHKGDILVTPMTDPDWVPIMKQAAGIITERGGRTCHAAIVSRELGIPAIIGVAGATTSLKHDQEITLDCSQGERGFIYDGLVPFTVEKINVDTHKKLPVELMVNISEPEAAFRQSFLPVSGVGLARTEFILSAINIHPMAIVEPEKLPDAIRREIEQRSVGYQDPRAYFIDQLAFGTGKIAAAFYPRPVIVRLSDFKSNEYRNLLGGSYFEPIEENPMIGFRGAFRYTSKEYAPAFALECEALKKVRETMGLKNVRIMVPFVRTTSEAKAVIAELERQGIIRGKDDLQLFMMCEIPSNVILMEQFCAYFDGISIGSNDLTQLTLGVDRDSALLEKVFDERDEAVKKMMALAIEGAKRAQTYIGICGEAPSDYPEVAQFLIEQGIDSISLNPDAVLPYLQ